MIDFVCLFALQCRSVLCAVPANCIEPCELRAHRSLWDDEDDDDTGSRTPKHNLAR